MTLGENEKDNLEPWEAFKWTPLRKISDHLHSEAVRHNGGLPTVIAVSGVIAIGTTRGLVLVYDYSQNLRCILGDESQSNDAGPVTSIAISADHTGIACGYSRGSIVIWDLAYPNQPVRKIHPIPYSQVSGASSGGSQPAPRKEGHIQDSAILHIGFVGLKKTEIVSGDDRGMAFYHVLYKVVMVNAIETTRILGRYQNLSLESASAGKLSQPVAGLSSDSSAAKPKRPSTVFAMQPLPLGQAMHVAETFGLVALLTPYKVSTILQTIHCNNLSQSFNVLFIADDHCRPQTFPANTV
jgi:WD40 repeat protein